MSNICFNRQLLQETFVLLWRMYLCMKFNPSWQICLAVNAIFFRGGVWLCHLRCVYSWNRHGASSFISPTSLYVRGAPSVNYSIPSLSFCYEVPGMVYQICNFSKCKLSCWIEDGCNLIPGKVIHQTYFLLIAHLGGKCKVTAGKQTHCNRRQ